MDLKEKALKHLSKYDKMYPPGYLIIDPLIKPLCRLLSENGYITLHSCSSHVRVKSRICKQLPDEYEYFPKFYRSNQWYVVFAAIESIEHIKNVVKIINKKYNYNLICIKAPTLNDGITNRWLIETHLDFNYNNKDIYELNKNVYLEFKKYFEQNFEQKEKIEIEHLSLFK